MSSFFNRQPEMFDAKKRLGSGNGGAANSGGNSSASQLSATDLQLAVDDVESAAESWVELAPSRQSLCSSVEAIAMADAGCGVVGAGGDVVSNANSNKNSSPVSLQSPKSGNSNSNNSVDNGKVLESSLEQVKYRLATQAKHSSHGKGTTDWIWDWSSRPEAHPNRMLRNRSDNGTNEQSSGNAGVGSAMTTPPNSPVPEHISSPPTGCFGFGDVNDAKPSGGAAGYLRLDVLMGLVFSNLVTFVLGASIGYYVCRKWSRGQSGSASGLGDSCLGSGSTMISYYNW